MTNKTLSQQLGTVAIPPVSAVSLTIPYTPLAKLIFNLDGRLDITRSVDVDHVLTDHHDDVLGSALGADLLELCSTDVKETCPAKPRNIYPKIKGAGCQAPEPILGVFDDSDQL